MRPTPWLRSAGWPRPNATLRPSLSVADRLHHAQWAGDVLREQGAAKVWLFGSLAKGRRQDWRSDIDLALDGLAPGNYLSAFGELISRLPLDVDLIEMETASEPLRAQVLSSGILLHAS